MNGPILFHLVLGAVILALGVWMLKRRKTVIGWTLTGLGVVFALMGVFIQVTHRVLHH